MSEIPNHHGPGYVPDGNYPNDTVRLLNERASVRSYQERGVPPEVLRVILESGIHAPTGGNLQPYSIVKIEEEENRRWFVEQGIQGFVAEAPVLLLFCIDFRRLKRWAMLEVAPFTATSAFHHFWISFQDTVMCAQNICTAADAMGLGSCYIGSVLEMFEEIREKLKLREGVLPVVLLTIGYPSDRPLPRKKLGVDIIVHDEFYSDLGDDELLKAFKDKYTGKDSRSLGITEERLNTFRGVCSETQGEEFAERAVEKVRENGHFSAVQRYFGLHYRADLMPRDNLDFLDTMEEFGFNWFKEFEI